MYMYMRSFYIYFCSNAHVVLPQVELKVNFILTAVASLACCMHICLIDIQVTLWLTCCYSYLFIGSWCS